jgi:hypothetical protein
MARGLSTVLCMLLAPVSLALSLIILLNRIQGCRRRTNNDELASNSFTLL